MLTSATIPSHSSQVVFRRINNECLLIPLTSDIADMNSIFRLNDTGAFIWESIDGKRSIGELAAILSSEFCIESNEAEKDIISFLEEVHEMVEFH